MDAVEKLRQEQKNHDKGLSKQAAALIHPIGEMLISFCRQDKRFADAVFEKKETLSDCVKAVANGTALENSDVNGDGKINNRDLAVMQQYLNDWEVVLVVEALDINGDGTLTVVFEDICPVVFCVDPNDVYTPPKTGDAYRKSLIMWTLLLIASAVSIAVLLYPASWALSVYWYEKREF